MKSQSDSADERTRISLVSGTKAQFIKMMPIAWELERRRVPYRVIDTGQHEAISSDLRSEYGVRPPDHSLGRRYGNVNTIGRGMAWLASNLYRHGIAGERSRRALFGNSRGIALVHGDTASTVLGAVIAKRAGQKVVHIEAGLRSWNLLNPFPEELVRILVMRMSDHLIAPSPEAYENLAKMGLEDRSRRVSGNTLVDVVSADLERKSANVQAPDEPYAVVTIHRMETLYNRRRLEMVVESVLRAQEKLRVLFVQHAPTARRLSTYGMLEALEREGVRLLNLLDHGEFVHLLAGAELVMTDGGSVQEEASYLGVPCLLMRKATERPDGLGANVVLSNMNEEAIHTFIENYPQHRRPAVDFANVKPGTEVVDILLEEARV